MLPNVSVLPVASLVQKHLLPSQPERLIIMLGKVNHYCQLGSRCLRTRFRASVRGLGGMVRSDEASLYFRLYATKYPSR